MNILPPNLLDQLQTFVLAADLGSFNAAARQMNRAQSAISYAINNLEKLLGIPLFDRAGHKAVLTPAGRALLRDARSLVEGGGRFMARARDFSGGIEPEIRLACDQMFPLTCLTAALDRLQAVYPHTRIHMDQAPLGDVWAMVARGRATLGFATHSSLPQRGYEGSMVGYVKLISVAAPSHPLVSRKHPVDPDYLRPHRQIVLWARDTANEEREAGVFSTDTWRVGDLTTKLAMLEAGLGWGSMPEHLVADALEQGRLQRIHLSFMPDGILLPLVVFRASDKPIGRAARFLMETVIPNYTTKPMN